MCIRDRHYNDGASAQQFESNAVLFFKFPDATSLLVSMLGVCVIGVAPKVVSLLLPLQVPSPIRNLAINMEYEL